MAARVGYVQSNFNSDNCLMGGTTLDYGPFGFLEKYDPRWGMWIGSGDHFSFLNQPAAAAANFKMLATSLESLLDDAGKAELQQIVQHHYTHRGRELGCPLGELPLHQGKAPPA